MITAPVEQFSGPPQDYPSVADHIEAVLETYRSSRSQQIPHHPEPHQADLLSESVIRKACQWAQDAHASQYRKSGELYIHHPLAVAYILARLGFDETVLSAAILHDVLEDTTITHEILEENFGSETTMLVSALTKLDKLKLADTTTSQISELRKMLVAMASDLRVLVIKFADRLHNMKTISALPPDRQHRIATETLEIYAPLADRFGMESIKTLLEDLTFAVLHPKWYSQIDYLVEKRAPERDLYLTQIIAQIQTHLAAAPLEVPMDAEVVGRPKHLWSIYDKMQKKQLEFDQIYDLIGIRIIVDNAQNCYAALGAVHALWKPVHGRFKDYISMPKFNLYQSLHTTVAGPGGKLLEVQIRTQEMHQRAENGLASHWDYKDENANNELLWMTRLLDWAQDAEEQDATISSLAKDLAVDEVYVFTPLGKVITLPYGSTPVDFAYAVHTQVGHRCVGAKINGRLSALDTSLATGDTVEILTSKSPKDGPSSDWLSFVVTQRARNRIRQWFTQARRAESVAQSEPPPSSEISQSTVPASAPQDLADYPLRTYERRTSDASGGVHVEGLSDLLIRMSKCCSPVPNDEIIGFTTRGRGVSIHRVDCSNAVLLLRDQPERCMEVEWDTSQDRSYVAKLEVRAFDRQMLLPDIAQALAEHHVKIVASSTNSGKNGVCVMQFDVELADNAQIKSLLQSIRNIDHVYSATRANTGSASPSTSLSASQSTSPSASPPAEAFAPASTTT